MVYYHLFGVFPFRNNYFQVSFKLKAILYPATITQNTVTELQPLRLILPLFTREVIREAIDTQARETGSMLSFTTPTYSGLIQIHC